MRKPERLSIRPVAVAAKPTRIRPPRTLPIDDPAPDPLVGVEFSPDIEEASTQQLDAIQSGFRERAKAEAERFKSTTDTGYYVTVVFQSAEQVDAFLAKAGIETPGRFIDGLEMADAFGVDLPKATVPRMAPKIDRKLSRLVRQPGE